MKRLPIWVALLLPLASACLSVLGADDFQHVDQGAPAGSGGNRGGSGGTSEDAATGGTGGSGDGGATAAVPDASTGPADAAPESSAPVTNPCAADEVLADGGSCEQVGVTPSIACKGPEFSVAADGACAVVMPDAECKSGLAYPGLLSCQPAICNPDDDGYAAGPTTGALYVAKGAPQTCAPRGTKGCPFATIGDALTALPSSGGLILLHTGVYAEDVAIATSNVTIDGCGATIHGQATVMDPASPCFPSSRPAQRGAAVCVAPNVTNIEVDHVAITGNGYGFLVSGGSVTLNSVFIYDTASYGVLVQEAKLSQTAGAGLVKAAATMTKVSVLRAGGVGIQVEGSSLIMGQSSVQDTQMLNRAPAEVRATGEDALGLGRGIALYSSSWTASAVTVKPTDFAPSTAQIDRTAITGNEEIGLYVGGATATTVTRSFIGGLAKGSPAGRGLVVERSLATATPSDVTVSETVFDGNRDAAVDVRDAALQVTESTLRSTRGRLGDGCTGQGVRVRSLPPGDARSVVTLDHVSVLNSRQSAVFVGSSKVNLANTLLSGVAPKGDESECKKAMGDGLDVESYPGEPAADVTVDHTRIENAKRAGIFAGTGDVSLSASVVACNGYSVVDATTDRSARPLGALCGCASEWVPCTFESVSVPLDSWAVSGASPVWPDRTSVAMACLFDQLIGDPPIREASLWSPFSPEIVPSVIGDNCVDVAGIGTGWASLAVSKAGFYAQTMPFYFPEARTSMLIPIGTTPISTLYGTVWPIGVPLVAIFGAPNGSTVELGPVDVLMSLGGGAVISGGTIPGTTGQSDEELLQLPEGGWHSVSFKPPSIFTCVAHGPTSLTDPTVLPVHVIPGTIANAQFDCHVTDPAHVLNHADQPITPARNAAGESPLGDLVADCMRSTIHAQFGVINSSAMGVTGLAGPDITWNDVNTTLHFANDMVTLVSLTGQQLIDLLNEQWFVSPPNQIKTRPLEVSGLTYTWNALQPVGSRIIAVYDAQGNPLQLGTAYDVAIPNFMLSGGFPAVQNVVPEYVGASEAVVFGNCIESMPSGLPTATDGRVTRQN